MFKYLLALVSVLSPSLMAADGALKRTTLEKDLALTLTLKDDRPVSITLDDKKGWSITYNLRFEGTYGSPRASGTEYFEVSGHPSRSSLGEGKMKVVIHFGSIKEQAQIGGLALHGEFGACVDTAVGEEKCKAEIAASREKSKAFDGKNFSYYVDKNAAEPFLPAVTQGNERIPFCTAEKGLAILDNAICSVDFSDIYDPLDEWFVMFGARDLDSNYGSASSYSNATFGEPDGNGIQLDKAKEPGCVKEKSCVIHAGYIRYWRTKKKAYFIVETKLEEGRPVSAVAHGLEYYGGKVGR